MAGPKPPTRPLFRGSIPFVYSIIIIVTAEHIYDQCDGMEYENSASTLDLRFVPSDTEFDHEPYAIATENSVASDFVPSKQVVNNAGLSHFYYFSFQFFHICFTTNKC